MTATVEDTGCKAQVWIDHTGTVHGRDPDDTACTRCGLNASRARHRADLPTSMPSVRATACRRGDALTSLGARREHGRFLAEDTPENKEHTDNEGVV